MSVAAFMPPPPRSRGPRPGQPGRRRPAATGRSGAGTRRPGSARTAGASGPAATPGRAAGAARAARRPVAGVQPHGVPCHGQVTQAGLPGQRGGGPPAGLRVAGDEDDRVPGHLLLEGPRATFRHHGAVIDDHDVVAEHVRLVQVVRGQEDRGTPVPQAADVVPQAGPVLRVEPGARLIQEQDLGLVHDAERHVEAPSLAAGVGPDPAVGEPGQVEPFQHLRDPPGDVRAAPAVQPALQGQVLPSGGQLVGPAQLAHVADAGPDLPGLTADVQPGHRGAAAVDGQQRGQHPQRGGLARPVRPQEPDDLAPGDLQADAAHRLDRLVPAPREALAQLPGVDDRSHGAPSGRLRRPASSSHYQTSIESCQPNR